MEWAHALAPGAVTSLSWSRPILKRIPGLPQDIDIALLYTVANHLGNVIFLQLWFARERIRTGRSR